MFYFYTIVIPIVIIIVSSYINKPKSYKEFLNCLLWTLPFMLVYSIALYFLELNDAIQENWTFYTIWFFAIISYPIILILRLLVSLKDKS